MIFQTKLSALRLLNLTWRLDPSVRHSQGQVTNHMAKLWSRHKYRYTTGAHKLVATHSAGNNYMSWKHVEPRKAREVLFTQWNESY